MDSVMNDEWPEPQVKDHDAGRRLYDCTYCKRGFTNAQALGGHMNIHRKDRAKIAKQPNNPNHHPRDVDQHSVQTPTEPESSDCYPVLETQRAYYAYLLPSGSADPIRRAASPRMWDQGLNVGNDEEEHVDANLSLRVGPAPTEEEHNRGAKKGDFSEKDDDDLDLELRLGHDP